MHWRLKALIQNGVATLPSSLSYPTYYWIQRHFGGLRCVTPIEHFSKAVEFCDRLDRMEAPLPGRRILEIGTGRRINVPLAYWLCGAREVVTVDLNPYLREELVREDISYISGHEDEIANLFGRWLDYRRFKELKSLAAGNWIFEELLAMCQIRIMAPANATDLALESDSIDCHTSLNVFEHIPGPTIEGILAEGNRLLKSDGVFLHRVDYSDHFAHSDRSLSPVHFLRFSDRQWGRLAGNRYMYANRLRVDDVQAIFLNVGHDIVLDDPDVDLTIQEQFAAGRIKVDDSFAHKSPHVLATTASWIGSRKRTPARACFEVPAR